MCGGSVSGVCRERRPVEGVCRQMGSPKTKEKQALEGVWMECVGKRCLWRDCVEKWGPVKQRKGKTSSGKGGSPWREREGSV